MAIYRQIHISYWQDPFILELTPEEKYFYFYLMTNSKTKQCGVYELPKKVMELETGYNQETINKLLARFIEYGKIDYCELTKEILVKNWLKYNSSKSPKVMMCIEKELQEIKYIPFKKYTMDSLSIDYGEEEEQEEEKEQEQKEEVHPQQIADLYSSICKNLPQIRKLSENRKKKIRTRLKEYPTIETWQELFEKVNKSDFLNGKNDRKWKADFEWLLEEKNLLKVLEGRYDNKAVDEFGNKSNGTDLNSLMY